MTWNPLVYSIFSDSALLLREELEIFDEYIDGQVYGVRLINCSFPSNSYVFCGSFSCFQETNDCDVESPAISAIVGFAIIKR